MLDKLETFLFFCFSLLDSQFIFIPQFSGSALATWWRERKIRCADG